MRNIICKMKIDGYEYLANEFQDIFINIMDDVQLIMDKQDFSSEIHIVGHIKR